jgi:transcription factor CRZ1
MDQQGNAARGRSPSAGHQQQPHIRNSHSPSPHPYPSPEPSIGLGLGIDNSAAPQFTNPADFTNFDASSASNTTNPAAQFLTTTQSQIYPTQGAPEFTQSFNPQNLLAQDFNGNADFSLFPPTSQGDQFGTPLFGDSSAALGTPDLSNMTSPQTHHSPTPPHMLKPDPHQPGSAHQSPSFNQHQFSSPHQHSRNVSASLAPEAALLAGHVDWSQPQFHSHRRSPSEFSDVSSAHPSPNLVASDTFQEAMSEHGHSPMQRPQDTFDYGVSTGLGNFSISDPQMVPQHSRSPSHSPAMSPRIMPAQMTEMGQPTPSFALGHTQGYMSAPTIAYPPVTNEAFPPLATDGGMMAPPSIKFDLAPDARQNAFDGPKQAMDQDSLTPPDRGTVAPNTALCWLSQNTNEKQADPDPGREPSRILTITAVPTSRGPPRLGACLPTSALSAPVTDPARILRGRYPRLCRPARQVTGQAVQTLRLGGASPCLPSLTT